jgi:polygalacturonase
VFKGTDRGIRFKTMRGRGGYIEDVCISNIVMYDILKQGIMMNMRYHETPVEPVSERTPTIRNVSISNVRINKADQAIAFLGLEERSIENIRINGVNVNANQGIFGEYATDIDLSDIRIRVDKGIPVEFRKSKAIQLKGLTVTGENLEHGAISLHDVKDMLITDCFQTDVMSYFLDVDNSSETIYLLNNVLPGVSKATLQKSKAVYQSDNILGK